MTFEPNPHQPVLVEEIGAVFAPCCLLTFADGTVGAGGHAEGLLRAHPEIQNYHAFDRDLSALDLAKRRLALWNSVYFYHKNFSLISEVCKEGSLDGILIDLGVSSMQLDQAERGFSFLREGPLDMRMDRSEPLSAYDIVNGWSEAELGKIFREYGEERQWRKAAFFICKARRGKPLKTTNDLKEVLKVLRGKKEGIDPATKVFQAIRIAVNGELDHLAKFLGKAVDLLRPKGRLALLSFHSLEDRMVKQCFAFEASDKHSPYGKGGLFLDKKPRVKIVTKKALMAHEKELLVNRRARSAKLRVIEKL